MTSSVKLYFGSSVFKKGMGGNVVVWLFVYVR